MKKLIILAITLLISFSSFAQEQGDFRGQLGGNYRFGLNEIGLHGGVEYLFIDRLSLAPSFNYWFPRIGRTTSFNMDLRYYLSTGTSQVYLMGGYNNYWFNTQPGNVGETISRSGGNFGIGSFFSLYGPIGMNLEFKWESQNSRNTVMRVGLVYSFN